MAQTAAPKPLPTPSDRFDAERWITATNLYWLDVVTQLVAGLNQVRTDPLVAYPAVSAPTAAAVREGVVAKYQALG